MTLILNLSSAEEARLTAAARQAGLAPDALLRSFVNRLPLAPDAEVSLETIMKVEQEISEQKSSEQNATVTREAAIRAARGRMAHFGASVEDLHQQRQTDKAHEQDLDH